MNSTGISEFNQARIEWAIRLRYSPMPELDMDVMRSQLNALRIGELRTIGKTWEVMMERDGELAVNSEKRKSDSACLEWQISSDGSPDGDKHAAALEYFYNNLTATKALDQDATGSVDELVFQTLSAVDYYYSAHEILLRTDNPAAKEVTAEFRHTPVWFFESRRGYLGYLKHIFDMYGQPCIAGEWLTAVNTGWMRPLSIAYIAKWSSLTDWFIFCHRYGSGFLEAITDATKDSQEWNDAQKALDILSADGTVLHNKGVEMKFLEQSSRNQLPYQPVVELVDRLYAKCYRGVDLATGSRAGDSAVGGGRSGGRNAVGASVQKEESGILLVRDAKWITGVFNDRIDRPILRYLFNEEPRAWFALLPPLDDTSSEDLQSLQTLVPMGLRVALKEVYKRFRWSVPDDGDPCLQTPQAPSPEDGGSKMEDGKATAAPSSTINPQSSKPLLPEARPEDDGKTQSAKTSDQTPIAPGADPARNPGLAAPAGANYAETSSRQLPDTQVDAGAFWSRVGLAPRGADGQTLPMPSLGYAVPNNSKAGQFGLRRHVAALESADMSAHSKLAPLLDRHANLVARGLGNSRAAQALHREINRRRAESASLANDDDHFNPDEHRDKDGKWTAGPNATGSKTNNPAQTNTPPRQTAAQLNAELLSLKPKPPTINRLSDVSCITGGKPVEFAPSTEVFGELADTFRTMPGQMIEGLGEFSKAVVGDIAAGFRFDPEFSGNIPALFTGAELPIDKALRDAAEEQNFRGEVPIATVMGRISEGIATTLPMIPLMEALPLKARQAALVCFTVRMAAETPEIAKQLGDEYGKPPDQRDPNKIDSLVAQAIQTIGMTAAGGVGVKRAFTPTVPPANVPVQWRGTQRSRQSQPNVPSEQPTGPASAEDTMQKSKPESTDSGPTDPSKPADAIAPSPKPEPTPSQKAAARLQANKAAGRAFEKEVTEQQLPKTQDDIREQITIESNGPSGKRVRVDAVGIDKATGKIRLSDAKASATAPLTPNQTVVYPELEIYGGRVVGEGKPPYTGGTEIPPTKVDIIRKP